MINNYLRMLIISILFIWVGLIIGISFIEAPIKFQAPKVTLEIGLGIGRLVFGAMNKLELLFSVILFVPVLLISKWEKSAATFAFLAIAILLSQTFFLLPQLDRRAEMVVNREILSPSSLHSIYVALEVSKLLLVAISGVIFLKSFDHEKRY